jgi:fatty-acyl-CoA synthase
MRALGCGAEPIQADVLRAFLDRFAPQGLRPESILPSYGMAEATLAIAFADVTAPLTTDWVDLQAMRAGEAVPAGEGPTMELVACGGAFPGHEIAIFDRDGGRLPERQVGEIRLRGPSVTAGYYGDAESTAETFGDGWLHTGDLGYLAGGQLYICGRAKDLIILNGKNYYPQDVERIVSRVDGVRDGQCVAFSRLDATGAEIAVVVTESRQDMTGIAAAIVAAVRVEMGLCVSEVHFIKRGTLPKTSSGKVRRRECRRRLEADALERLSELDVESVTMGALPPNPRAEGSDTLAPPTVPDPGPARVYRPASLQGAPHGIQ